LVFQTDYDKITLCDFAEINTIQKIEQKKSILRHFSDAITTMSPKNVTNFSILSPSQSEFLATPVLKALAGVPP